MPHFKDQSGKLHFITSADVERGLTSMLPATCLEISDEQAHAIQNTPPTSNQILIAQIADLEAKITPRRLREAVLASDNGWLKGVEAQITALRNKLVKS